MVEIRLEFVIYISFMALPFFLSVSSWKKLHSLKQISLIFGLLSGMRINLNKCTFFFWNKH